jgi:ribosomal-protein-serine acetyltransferase
MPFELTVDDDITLELLEDAQADELFSLVDDARDHLGDWLPWVKHTREVSDSEQFIRTSRAKFGNKTIIPAGIRYRGELCGHAGLHIDDGVGELGYWLHPDWQGNGIVTRCCRVLTTFGFRWRDLHRIEIRAEPRNQRSCAVPERLDFTLEGTLRGIHKRDGDLIDLRVYSVLADEWPPGR